MAIKSTHIGNNAVPYNKLVQFRNSHEAENYFGRTALPLYTISRRYVANLRPGDERFARDLLTGTQLYQPTRTAAGVSWVTPILVWHYPQLNQFLYTTEGPPPGGASDFHRAWDRVKAKHEAFNRSFSHFRPDDRICYFHLVERVVHPITASMVNDAVANGTPYMNHAGPDGEVTTQLAMTDAQYAAMQTAEAQAAEPLIIRPEPIDVRTIVQATKHVERNQMPHSASGRTQTSKRRRRAARKVKH